MESFDFDINVVKDYGYTPRGVIHVGAHHCEEAGTYHQLLGNDNIVWFEAVEEYAVRGLEYLDEHYPKQRLFNSCLSNVTGWSEIFLTSNEFASSLLEPTKEMQYNPHVSIEDRRPIFTTRFDDLMEYKNVRIPRTYNMLVMDTQGSELFILQGFGKYLDQIDIIVSEYQNEDTYKDVPRFQELTAWLDEHGFDLVMPSLDTTTIAGDALYTRKPK